MKTWIAAFAACALLPAAAQSLSYTPTEGEVQQARANAKRDARLADAMEKARLAQEARGPFVYIPKEKVVPVAKDNDDLVVTHKKKPQKPKKAKKAMKTAA
jgi:hypothetical protein